jgi:import inner membrane translocase subunit TIM9
MDQDQARMLAALEEMQMRDSLRTFNGLVERCFTDCVTGFRSKTLTDHEDKCVKACAEKFFNHAVRASLAPHAREPRAPALRHPVWVRPPIQRAASRADAASCPADPGEAASKRVCRGRCAARVWPGPPA